MDDSGVVHGRQPAGHERAHPAQLAGAQGAGGGQQPAQVAAVDEVHDNRETGALNDHVAHAHDVGRAHPQQGGALLDEALDDGAVVQELGAQQFDGQGGTGVLDAVAAPDLALRAGANARIEDVGAAQATGLALGENGR